MSAPLKEPSLLCRAPGGLGVRTRFVGWCGSGAGRRPRQIWLGRCQSRLTRVDMFVHGREGPACARGVGGAKVGVLRARSWDRACALRGPQVPAAAAQGACEQAATQLIRFVTDAGVQGSCVWLAFRAPLGSLSLGGRLGARGWSWFYVSRQTACGGHARSARLLAGRPSSSLSRSAVGCVLGSLGSGRRSPVSA